MVPSLFRSTSMSGVDTGSVSSSIYL